MKKNKLLALFGCIIALSHSDPIIINASNLANDVSYVENYEITLPFYFGTRKGMYTGALKNDLPYGIGEFISQNDSGTAWTYVGEWEDGHFSGNGITFFEDNNIKAGTYVDDYLSGNNCLVLSGNGTYYGEFENEVASGKGTSLTLTERYVGEFKNGLYDGQGVLYYENGQRYEGSFSEHKINGNGSFFFADGSHVNGTFKTNKDTGLLDGSGTFYYPSSASGVPCKYESGNVIFQEPAVSVGTISPTPTITPSKTETTEIITEKESHHSDQSEEKKQLIEQYIRNRVYDNYKQTDIDSITINDDLGTDIDGDYVALVNLTWNVKNSQELSEKMLRMYSDDLAASLATDYPDVQELCVFWKVPYLTKYNSKWAYEKRDNGMYLVDNILGW